jgi:hypothetical protein
VTPLLLLALGAVALVGAVAILRSFGPGYRVGRLLASTRRISVEAARAIADAGERRYVRVDGRIDSAEDFEDADHRPLVLRRTRVFARRGRGWETVEDGREVVPFEIHEGLAAVEVDGAALDDGLVVVPRLSAGVAANLGDRSPAGIAPETPVRVRIEQVSSVEHAVVLGVPLRVDGRVRMISGLGRPLVLTTLEVPEAMRVLTGGAVWRSRAAFALLAAGVVLIAAGIAWAVVAALVPPAVAAASPSAPPGGGGGDPRSVGEGPGLVGDPLFAIGAVVLIAVAAIVLTTLYVRATGGPRR